MKRKYIFLKRLYINYVIIFIKNRRYYVLFDDKMILKCFNNKKLLYNFWKYHINYIIIDDFDIVDICRYDDNRYSEFLFKGIMIDKVDL